MEHIWPVDSNIPMRRIGSESQSDGGYLVPDDLQGIGRVFSPGVADTMDFEEHFLEKGVPCELIDGSISSLPTQHPLANFQKLWIGSESSADSISLSDWVAKEANEDEELILQMDIEGGEYESLVNEPRATLERFRVIVLEIHHLREAFSYTGFAMLTSLIRKLKETHYVVHAHPNNCCPALKVGSLIWPSVLELTLLRKDRMEEPRNYANIPHALDQDNTDKPTLELKPGKFFYEQAQED